MEGIELPLDLALYYPDGLANLFPVVKVTPVARILRMTRWTIQAGLGI